MSSKKSKKAWKARSQQWSSQAKKSQSLYSATAVFEVVHQGTIYFVHRMSGFSYRVSLVGGSGRVVRPESRLWKAVVRKAKEQADLHEVGLIMEG